MIRAVIDTNVFVSAALKQKSPPSVAIYLAQHGAILLKSSATEAELLKVMARPRLAPLIPQATLRWILHVLAGAETIAITEQVVACRDHDDDKFLELAVNGRAELIISGDRDLLSMESFRGIPIISPAVFVRRVTDPSDA